MIGLGRFSRFGDGGTWFFSVVGGDLEGCEGMILARGSRRDGD